MIATECVWEEGNRAVARQTIKTRRAGRARRGVWPREVGEGAGPRVGEGGEGRHSAGEILSW